MTRKPPHRSIREQALAERSLLYVYPFCNLGGVASVLKQRLPYLTEAGFEVDGLFLYDYGGQPGLQGAGVRRITITLDPSTHLVETASHYDAVCIIDMPAIARSLGQLRESPPLIYEIHSGIESVVLKNDNESLLACRCVIVPSRWLKDLVRKHFPILADDSVLVCPNIVNATMFRPSSSGDGGAPRTGDVIWVGKVDEHKNWREAVQIMHRYFQTKPHAHGILVTGGRLTDRLMDDFLEELEQLGMSRRIFWLHNVPYAAMPDLYQRIADSGGALLQCSKAESFGMVAHEAARCGVPAVTRRSGAVAEFVRHGVSGWLYEDGDVEGASRGLLELTDDDTFRSQVLKGIKAQLDLHDPDLLGCQYVGILERLLGK